MVCFMMPAVLAFAHVSKDEFAIDKIIFLDSWKYAV